MPTNIVKSGFLAILTFLTFILPLLLADEVSLLANWLFIFISWSLVILLSALSPAQIDNKTSEKTDLALKESP
ncbi:hypothetical protein [Colwellia piezophila]|uniref:hypothetical protein n=1 Tax=Colwellia piezophila TaxID=211668 RepID=UPI000365B457|nr:hypothetical protein [Colwellia piezophila]